MASRSLLIPLILFPFFACSFASTFIISNNCPFTIWPGTLAGSGTPQLPSTGFQLDSGKSMAMPSVPGWSGRIWARTGCTFDATGVGSCQTGDCGGKLECAGMGAKPPASLFEITLGTGDQKDFYDVSIVDGYNLPLVAAPRGVYGCNVTGCVADINMGCPKELQVVGSEEGEGGVVACKSACEAFGLDQYCCSGEFANPSTCRPSFYSGIFKRACPRAYSYAFDDGTSTFTCKAPEYAIIFCPNRGIRRVDSGLQPPTQGGLQSPPVQGGLQPPPTQGGLQPPPIQGGLQPPPIQGGFQPPPIQGGFQSPPIQGGFHSPPIQGGLQPPPIQGGLPSPIQDGLQSPPVQDGLQSPPIQDGLQSPVQEGLQTPPLQDGLQSPVQVENQRGKSIGAVSSSGVLPPFPISVSLLLFLLYLWHT